MKRKTKHLIVISFDGLSTLDFDYISHLPHFQSFLQKASYCKKVTSIYPTLTYPAHASIITGRYPKDHGIVSNTLLQPHRKKPDWYWQRKYIKGETLYDQAIDQGLKVAALLWPVTAKSRIQCNMPEIIVNRPWQTQLSVSLLNGTARYQYKLNKMFGHIRKGISQPELDHFTQQSLLYTLKEYKPDLTLVHFTDLDTQRHGYGFYSTQAKEALERHDQRLGEIMKTLQKEKMDEESTLILLGDHGSIDTNKIIYLNSLFQQKGYLHIKDGIINKWEVIAKTCDGSTYIYIKNKQRKKEVEKLLHDVAEDQKNGIETVYSREEAESLGADPHCAFMLEASVGYYFSDQIREVQWGKGFVEKGSMTANHGYSPYKPDYTTVFMISGQGIKPNVVLDQMSLLDEGPTMAALLGVNLQQAEGRIIEEILT
ncbi:MAG: alkaline phosphatase family protein [Epulopiscium sp.]|nr:alkaline phosphatase family protein [Candidatus Epulonipiscium sp.]